MEIEIGSKKKGVTPDYEPWFFPSMYDFGLSHPTVPNTFTFFGGRLKDLHDEMEAWCPQTLRQILRPAYTDRFNYYTQRFTLFITGMSLVIALFGLFGVGLIAVQTAYAVKIQITLEGVELQKLAMANSTRS
jgi:hypothetical protein